MADFELLVEKADKEGIKIIMDTVFNHAADNNDWYIDALNDLNSPYREYFYGHEMQKWELQLMKHSLHQEI